MQSFGIKARPGSGLQAIDTDCERGLALAAHLRDYPALARCAVALAEVHIGGRDLVAAGAVFDGCVAVCAAIPDAVLRCALLTQLLPMSMEVLNMQRACIVLSCGHAFHRDCCDAWMGSSMLASGSFQPECPQCGSLDPMLKPTPAALQELQHRRNVRLADCESVSGCASSSKAIDNSDVSSGDGSACTCCSSRSSECDYDGDDEDGDSDEGSENGGEEACRPGDTSRERLSRIAKGGFGI
ncbi:hypothetical protein GPECTOR_43g861 [Gonium pectorale]|uniref:RING-type domain-containing protein n=1 Tax=Gonium pectorale TaxID=33097 RepID=A0A150GA32_GONPE|nr:hypothetical protein GPECTOR_43g861 [Gonium pectorale]|eukprot:KXZ46425.1 hypothetical protein GPECTOR_43g861 [Gonium pectorale]